jgi:hypothetical protein
MMMPKGVFRDLTVGITLEFGGSRSRATQSLGTAGRVYEPDYCVQPIVLFSGRALAEPGIPKADIWASWYSSEPDSRHYDSPSRNRPKCLLPREISGRGLGDATEADWAEPLPLHALLQSEVECHAQVQGPPEPRLAESTSWNERKRTTQKNRARRKKREQTEGLSLTIDNATLREMAT